MSLSQKITVGDPDSSPITIEILRVGSVNVKLGITAPKHKSILRSECVKVPSPSQ
jgi:sRNA-binding carbon storage regulator CsrA